MKSRLDLIALAVGALLTASPKARAFPPTAHLEIGVVTGINCATRSISIQPKPGAAAKSFIWNDSTRFSHRGGCAHGGIEQGQTVRVYYRREYGQNVLREVSAKSAPAECHAVRK
ncbi:MAG: hypothetical protein KF791_09785 [Verrucomicrobiae bacterium]|nr:hypothetical protein [Verrucomicrobiae bacterium]